MNVGYNCTVELAEIEGLTVDDMNRLIDALNKNHYDWAFNDDYTELYINGTCEVDDYAFNADDVRDELTWLLWTAADIDADVEAEEIEPDEPDWDSMPGGYDTLFA